MDLDRFQDRLLVELPALLRAARRWTRRAADAEDLVQATVVRALERRADLRDEERMRGWLLSVQRTVLLNGARGARHRLELVQGGRGAETIPEPSANLEHEIVDRVFADDVDGALADLHEEWREALLLREVDELSYEEIARIQGCPVGTVRSRLARARLAMLQSLERKRDGEIAWKHAAPSGSKPFRRSTTAR